jgi:hypothetical protein
MRYEGVVVLVGGGVTAAGSACLCTISPCTKGRFEACIEVWEGCVYNV